MLKQSLNYYKKSLTRKPVCRKRSELIEEVGFITFSLVVVALGTLFFTNGLTQPLHEDVQTVASRGSSGG